MRDGHRPAGEDLLADVPADWPDDVVERFERLRRPDGGYAKSAEGALGSTYHAFLVSLIYELLGRETPNSNALIQFLYDQQREDGGFVEIAPMKRSGTNPTAAAAALLTKLGAIDDDEARFQFGAAKSEAEAAPAKADTPLEVEYATGMSSSERDHC